MQCGNFIHDLNRDIPNRAPGSNELARVIETLKEKTPHCGLEPETSVIPVYSIQTSINIFIVASLLISFLCLATPLIGLICQVVLLFLLLGELNHPFLAKAKPEHTTNLVFRIPARSKETQKIILTTSLTTDHFIDPPTGLSSTHYFLALYGLAAIPVVFQLWAMVSGLRWLIFLAILPLALLTFLPFVKRKTQPHQTLENCEVLLELGSILAKARPAMTSVTILLTGCRSLNSGIQTLDAHLKGTKINYVINLAEFPDKRINISTSDGSVFPLASDPILTDLLQEVSREKNIPTQSARIKEVPETYLLKLRKVKALTVTNPLLNSPQGGSAKDLRELLIGFIRKIDRTA